MKNVMMIQAEVRPETMADVEAAAAEMFGAIQAARPEGVKYASTRVADGTSVVVLLALDDPADNPLEAIPEFGRFQQQLAGWLAGPPSAKPLTVIGSYGLF